MNAQDERPNQSLQGDTKYLFELRTLHHSARDKWRHKSALTELLCPSQFMIAQCTQARQMNTHNKSADISIK